VPANEDNDELAELFDRLSEELEQAIIAGQTVDINMIATKYEVPRDQVEICLEALQALAGVVASPKEKKPQSLGPYEIKQELGRGGMGVVYQAYHPTLERDVAVKVSKFGNLATDDQQKRFLIEGRVVAKLRHPNIVSIHDVGMDEGTHYQVMDLIRGESLHSILKSSAEGPLAEALEFTYKLTEAMEHAHNRSIVHRDIKPRNVIINMRNEPILMDFGLAKDVAATSNTLTRTGQFIGTLRYASPEQMRSDRHLIDQRTDIYNLGATLYHMLCGQAPFAELPETETVTAINERKPDFKELSGITEPQTRSLMAVAKRCLEKDPRDRYQNAKDLKNDLERIRAGEKLEFLDEVIPEKSTFKAPVIFLLGLILGIIIGVGLGALLF
jgi:eukaryotic-like serine/threonine-protein kinase